MTRGRQGICADFVPRCDRRVGVPLTGTRITARFGAEGELSGDGGCNTYATTYHLSGDQLAIAPSGGTEKFCSEPIGIMDQEAQYASALQTAASYTLMAAS